jgi:CHRD domain/PEP-CTERM motif
MRITMKITQFGFCAALLFEAAAFAAPISYSTILNGLNESPPNASPGTGFASATIDTVAHSLLVSVNFAGLVGTTTASPSHIHCCTEVPFEGRVGGGATEIFPGFPIGVTAGSYMMSFDETLPANFNPAFLADNGGTAARAEAALALGLTQGRAYLNIHTTFLPGGEIKGCFLVPTAAVPEPASFLLAGAALAAVVIRRRRAVRG